MPRSRTSDVHDIGFFRNIGIVLIALAITAGSITLSLTVNYETTVASNIIANLTPLGPEVPQ